MAAKLGVLAGRGQVPRRLIESCLTSGREFFVVAFRGETEDATVAGVPHAWTELVQVGRVLDLLRREACREVCLIGPIQRPDLARLRPDWTGVRLLGRLLAAARRGGDDAMLSVVVDFLEEQGFAVVGAEQVEHGLAAPEGPLGRLRPAADDEADIRRAVAVIDALGRLDVGQAAVVRGGQVLAVEAAEGTDAMLERCRRFRGDRPAGVLVKMTKPQQERRADLPTIGVPTVRHAAEAGLAGIAVEAGGALVVDRDAVVRTADAAGLFICGIARGGTS